MQANLVELDGIADASFDHAACLFGTLGLIDGPDARRRFLTHVRRLLVPGGTFVVHVHNRWFHVWTRAGRRLLCDDVWRSALGQKRPGDFVMPGHDGIPGMPMHLFSRREIRRLLIETGFRVREVRPVSLRADGKLPWPSWLAGVRSYGFLVAAERSPAAPR
jgi:hypothetical protein